MLRIVSFRIHKIPFRLKAKQAKLTFFRYFALLIFAFVSLRFASKQNEGTPYLGQGLVVVVCRRLLLLLLLPAVVGISDLVMCDLVSCQVEEIPSVFFLLPNRTGRVRSIWKVGFLDRNKKKLIPISKNIAQRRILYDKPATVIP